MNSELQANAAFLTGGVLAILTPILWWRAHRIAARRLRASGRITHFISDETKTWKGEGQGSDTEIA